MRRRIRRIAILVVLSVLLNFVVAWSCALLLDPGSGRDREIYSMWSRVAVKHTAAIGVMQWEVEPRCLSASMKFSSTKLGVQHEDAREVAEPIRSTLFARTESGHFYWDAERSPLTVNCYGWPCYSHYRVEPRSLNAPDIQRWCRGRLNIVQGDNVWQLEMPYRVLWSGFALNTFLYFVLVTIAARTISGSIELYRHVRGHCPRCNFDLRHDLTAGCPECGWRRMNNPGDRAESSAAARRH